MKKIRIKLIITENATHDESLESLFELARKYKSPKEFEPVLINLLGTPEARRWERAWRRLYPNELFASTQIWAKANNINLKFYQKNKKSIEEIKPYLLSDEDKELLSSLMDYLNEKYPGVKWHLTIGEQPISLPTRIGKPKAVPADLWLVYDFSIMPQVKKLIKKYGEKEVSTAYDVFHEFGHIIGIDDEEETDRFALKLMKDFFKNYWR